MHADHVTAAWLLGQCCGRQIMLSADSGTSGAGRLLRHGGRIHFGSRYLQARATPGHTSGCLSFVLDNHQLAFTGDALLIRGCGRTDFQQGSADFQQGSGERLYRSVHEQLLTCRRTACCTRRTSGPTHWGTSAAPC